MRDAARRVRGLHVARAGAHGVHLRQVRLVALADLAQQARLGLAAIAGFVGRVRTEKNRVHPPAHGRQLLAHARLDGVDGGHVELPLTQARPDGRDRHLVAGVVELGDGLQRARLRLPVVGRAQVALALHAQDAVALDDDQSHGGDYPRGAKRPQRPHQRPASACSCALLPGLKRSSAKPSASRRWGSAGVLGASK